MPWKAWLPRPLVGGPDDVDGTSDSESGGEGVGWLSSEFSSFRLGLVALGSIAPEKSEFPSISLVSSASSASWPSIGPKLRLSRLSKWPDSSSFGEVGGDGGGECIRVPSSTRGYGI